jgi:hypothetical protein
VSPPDRVHSSTCTDVQPTLHGLLTRCGESLLGCLQDRAALCALHKAQQRPGAG